jgi:hypothetical protein
VTTLATAKSLHIRLMPPPIRLVRLALWTAGVSSMSLFEPLQRQRMGNRMTQGLFHCFALPATEPGQIGNPHTKLRSLHGRILPLTLSMGWTFKPLQRLTQT